MCTLQRHTPEGVFIAYKFYTPYGACPQNTLLKQLCIYGNYYMYAPMYIEYAYPADLRNSHDSMYSHVTQSVYFL